MDIPKLVREAKRGSAAAQQCLFGLYLAKLRMVCHRYIKSPEDAEERLMNGFHKFFSRLDAFEYKSEDELLQWLKQIMINECLALLRKKTSFAIVSESAAEEVAIDETGLDNLAIDEIMKTILQLPVGYRTVFNLHVIEGYGHQEIAGLLGITVGGSKSQLSKAKALLQKNLLQNGIDYAKRK